MNKLEYLIKDQASSTTKSFLIGDTKISGPSFIPEIKSEEDIEVLLRYSTAMNLNSPIMVPANRWMNQINTPRFNNPQILDGKISIAQLVKEHPIIFYEPPELYRYTLSKRLLTNSLKGNSGQTKNFKKLLLTDKQSEALDLVPRFCRPFLERQIKGIYSELEIAYPDNTKKDSQHVERGWLDSTAAESYSEYMTDIIVDALKMPSSTIIPPVPPLLKSSENAFLKRINSTNLLTSLLCEELSKGVNNNLRSYFHLYLDASILQEGQGNSTSTIVDLLDEGLNSGNYCGVALTFTFYEKVAASGKMSKIETLINEIINVSHAHKLPVILPRSGWYGLYLTDYDVQAFSSLLNGKFIYTKGGGIKNKEDLYGKTPLIDHGIELSRKEIVQYVNKNGELPKVKGLPSRPNNAIINDPLQYRINFSKAMRLIHVEEANRIRDGKLKGVHNPAQRYFERMEHPQLGGIR